jgi:hypothetical protein
MEELVIFQDVGPISMEEIHELRAKLTHVDLSVVTNKHSKCKPVCRAVTTTPPDVSLQTKYFVETLFQYVDPELLKPIESMVQSTSLDATSLFDYDESYARVFDITTERGQCVNVRNIVTAAIRLAVEYFRTHKIPKLVADLQRSRDPYVIRLCKRGMMVLQMHLPNIADPWDIRQLYMKLQAFAMFSTAIDAFSSFEEKIADLSDFGFIMQPMIISRVGRLCDQMQKYVPNMSTPFSIRTCLQTEFAKIYSTPTLRSSSCIYAMLHKPGTDIDDILCMAIHVAVHGLEYGYMSNIYTGSLTQVFMPKHEHTVFIEKVLHARESCELDLDDTGFIRRHRLRISNISRD